MFGGAQARFEAAQAKAAARAAAAAAARAQAQADILADEDSDEEAARGGGGGGGVGRHAALSIFDMGDDGWVAQDTPESLMPRIMELWHELAVPLAYRSRFFLGFKDKELFFTELEHRCAAVPVAGRGVRQP